MAMSLLRICFFLLLFVDCFDEVAVAAVPKPATAMVVQCTPNYFPIGLYQWGQLIQRLRLGAAPIDQLDGKWVGSDVDSSHLLDLQMSLQL